MNDKKYFLYIWKLLKPYRKQIILITVLMLISSIANMCVPLLQRQIIDVGIMGRDLGILSGLVLATIIVYLMILLLRYIQNRIQIEINTDFEKQMQIKSMQHLLCIRKDILDKEGILKLSKNADYYVEIISRITGSSILQILIEVFKLIGIIVAFILINWKIALFSFSFLPIKFLVTAFIGKYIQKNTNRNIEEHQKLHKWEEDVFNTIPEIKLWNLNHKKCDQYGDILSNILKIVKKSELLIAKDSHIGDGLAQILFNLLYLLSGIMIWNDTLTIGGLLVISSYFTYVLEPVSLFSSIGLIFSDIKPAIDKYEEYMSYPEDENISSEIELSLENNEYQIKITNLSFKYDENLVLKNIDLYFEYGKKYALIGENGAGKTTLIDLILRFLSYNEGLIELNNKPIYLYKIDNYREIFAVVTQQCNLFDASIKENITAFGRYSLNEKIIENPLFSFIKALPDGLNTNVGSKSSMLSGGEKQKIALARALIKKPKILILDEPTSNYDIESRKCFYNLLDEIKCTSIIISHDEEILQNVDCIVELESGNLKLFDSLEKYNQYRSSKDL